MGNNSSCDMLSHSATKKILVQQQCHCRRRLCCRTISNLSSTTSTMTPRGEGGTFSEFKQKQGSTLYEEKEEEKEHEKEGKETEIPSSSLCQICFDDSVNVVLSCGHEFCEDCLNDWTKKRNRDSVCPMCRTPLHEGVHNDDDDTKKKKKKRKGKWTSEVGWVLASEDDEMIKLATLALDRIWGKVLHSNKEVIPGVLNLNFFSSSSAFLLLIPTTTFKEPFNRHLKTIVVLCYDTMLAYLLTYSHQYIYLLGLSFNIQLLASAISVFGDRMVTITEGNVDVVCRRMLLARLNSIFT
mmetsp:Transcript_1119/g.1565  ORF Transcript_1119/g.1565 Transcript_1119/m.1565 type:complete len:297 (+) Transcript_1119:771-1661(+)